MELKPRQPVFIKEVQGNVWKTGIIDQPAKEPESYWVKFPDNSILRRTRSMIKPQLQPSYFELEAEGKDRNSSGHIPAKCSIPSTQISRPQRYQLCQWPFWFYHHWQARLHQLSRDKFPPVPLVHLQLPVAARKAVTQWFPPLQDGQPTALGEFHQCRFTPSKMWLCVYQGTLWKPVERQFLCT